MNLIIIKTGAYEIAKSIKAKVLTDSFLGKYVWLKVGKIFASDYSFMPCLTLSYGRIYHMLNHWLTYIRHTAFFLSSVMFSVFIINIYMVSNLINQSEFVVWVNVCLSIFCSLISISPISPYKWWSGIDLFLFFRRGICRCQFGVR